LRELLLQEELQYMLHKQDDPEATVPSCLKLIVTWENMCRFITSMKNSAQVPHRCSSREHRKHPAACRTHDDCAPPDTYPVCGKSAS